MDFFGCLETVISVFGALYILVILFDAVYDGITDLIQHHRAKKA